MRACGVVVEYNPFHNGHKYHVEQARKATESDCIVAVMSGPFLQRGEPALIDPLYRATSALANGVDIVVLLPFFYAVQSSNLFAYGAVQTLHQLGVGSICFGSEDGAINSFNNTYNTLNQHDNQYNRNLKKQLATGLSFPQAHALAFSNIKETEDVIDFSQPNNILGYSYLKQIRMHDLPMEIQTIKRKQSAYHEEEMTTPIASATSIRKRLLTNNSQAHSINRSMPVKSEQLLKKYKQAYGKWHEWEAYFPYVHYRVLSMSTRELSRIYTIEEGIEHRIKTTAFEATSFTHWMQLIKTKRYTWSRLQRMFVFIITHVTKEEVTSFLQEKPIPYVHLLGMTENGKKYLNTVKHDMEVPIHTSFKREQHMLASLEERAFQTYYSILLPEQQQIARKQLFAPPILST